MCQTKQNTDNILKQHSKCIFLGTVLALPVTTFAQQWEFEPVVGLTVGYNDNAQLTPDRLAEVDSAEFTVDANGRFVRRAQSSEVRIAPRIRSNTYADDTFEDTNDVFLDFFAGRNLQRSRFGLQARYAQEDVLTAEIDDPDFDNPDVNRPVNLDTGRIRIGSERESIIISPYFSHEWTETIGFGINADYIDVTYDQFERDLTDYTDASLGTELTFRISNRSTWSIGVFGSDYEAEAGADRSDSKTIGADLELRHEFSPTMEGSVRVGYEDVDSDFTSGGTTISESNGLTVFSAGITKSGDISRVVVDASLRVDPGGTGFLQERTQFRLRYTRQLSPTIFGNFNARIQTTKEVSPDPISTPDREYQRFGVGLEWRLSRIWSVRGNYWFTDQEFDPVDGSASSNEASLSLVYEPARRVR